MPTPRIKTYAWEFPIRLTHWINVLSILVFIVTGLYIADPYLHGIQGDVHVARVSGGMTPFHEYIMGYMRFIHLVTGYVFLCSFVIRIYWSFMGNRYASWRVWFPFKGQRWTDLKGAVKFYSFMSKKPPYAVGHTALAGLAYLVVFLIFGYQIVSGFALLSLSSASFLPTIVGGWLLAIMDLSSIRYWHHQLMYVLLAFFLIHIYISWWLDAVENNGLMGSIFGGYKFVTGKEWE